MTGTKEQSNVPFGYADLIDQRNQLLAVLEGLAVTAAVINNREPIGAEADSRTPEHWSAFRESINNAYTALAKYKGASK